MFNRFATALICGAAVVAACANDPITGLLGEELDENRKLGLMTDGIRVMTRNVYVGTDVDRVLAASAAEEIPVLAAEAFQGLLATDFGERARLFAREIAWTNPHLVGLQEISTIRVQSPGDAAMGGAQAAKTVVFDYLDILLAALEAEGLAYRAVATVQNADVEIPMLAGTDPLTFDDVRLTDFDVILARDDVPTADPLGQNYVARLTVPFGEGTVIEVPRGMVAVTATVQGRSYRFVNTHLEPVPVPELVPLQLAQAQELVSVLQAATDPVILVGDFNTHATEGDTYQLLVAQGFADVWLEQIAKPVQFTCCHALDLLNETWDFDRRIDLVFYRGRPPLQEVQAVVVGDEPENRTPAGMWPSDHAGVVANLRF
jgi:hypothetical protein